MSEHSVLSLTKAAITAAVIGAGALVLSVIGMCTTALVIVSYVYGG